MKFETHPALQCGSVIITSTSFVTMLITIASPNMLSIIRSVGWKMRYTRRGVWQYALCPQIISGGRK